MGPGDGPGDDPGDGARVVGAALGAGDTTSITKPGMKFSAVTAAFNAGIAVSSKAGGSATILNKML